MLDNSVPAVLLRIDPGPCRHATLGAVRSPGGRTGVDVHAVAVSQGSPPRRSGPVGAELPAPVQGVPLEETGATLRRVPASVAGPAFVIPMDAAGAIAVSRPRGNPSPVADPHTTPHAGSGFASRGRVSAART
ncbi:hypothetical protein [Streptomyces sp. NBC_00063]|uniref:hypothetical protein n=1 Tax=Streptomyces sp. NBC_00063 TaxID=2975638 RepID=UPI003D730AB4